MAYNQPPPDYATSSSHDPLLGAHQHDDVPDDFKYGVNVAQSDISIRMDFVRKVYMILTSQLVATTAVGATMMFSPSIQQWSQANPWMVWVSMFATFGVLFALFWKRRSAPTNYYLLGAFTLLEAYTIGNAVSYFDSLVVLQALVITLGVFIGLTLFTFQSKYDFTGLGPYLFAGIWILIITSLVQIFLPFNRWVDLGIAIGATVLFCGYILYDTYILIHHMSPEEYIMAAVSLYLDVINLFLSILRILNDLNRD
ncbi:uncharacterized protein VTP21DRAFT_6120 [Calcarisporiella thermophila]|uniref:uncharacterized protein n=1 Tax=Calcarisporiella thermophila TaxID=911321 RepID=UPI003742D097